MKFPSTVTSTALPYVLLLLPQITVPALCVKVPIMVVILHTAGTLFTIMVHSDSTTFPVKVPVVNRQNKSDWFATMTEDCSSCLHSGSMWLRFLLQWLKLLFRLCSKNTVCFNPWSCRSVVPAFPEMMVVRLLFFQLSLTELFVALQMTIQQSKMRRVGACICNSGISSNGKWTGAVPVWQPACTREPSTNVGKVSSDGYICILLH